MSGSGSAAPDESSSTSSTSSSSSSSSTTETSSTSTTETSSTSSTETSSTSSSSTSLTSSSSSGDAAATVAIARNGAVFGNTSISTVQNSDGSHSLGIAYAGADFTATSEKIVVSGMPISLAKGPSGLFAPMVVSLTGTSSTAISLYLQGNEMRLRIINGLFALSVASTASLTADSSFVWKGFPIALSSENAMLVKEATSGTVQESAASNIGGVPVLLRRIAGNWYLAISTETS